MLDWADGLQDFPLTNLKAALAHYVDDEGVPCMSREVWEGLIAAHDKDDIRMALADYVTDNGVPFPYQRISQTEAANAFSQLSTRDWRSFVVPYHDSYKARFEYDIWGSGLGAVSWGQEYNTASNYYQQANRYACRGYASRSPLEVWGDKAALADFNWPFWRYTLRGVNRYAFRQAFAISSYVAMQFKPQVAKVLYGWLGQGVVLDPSCGWGDRLAGFYCTPGSHTYLGSDPNRSVWEVYKQQALDYDRLLGGNPTLEEGHLGGVPYFTVVGAKCVTIFCAPAEDAPWDQVVPDTGVDLVFTSPPYFGVERYAEGTPNEHQQSWSRYPTFDRWLGEFLTPLFARLSRLVNDNGFCTVNIVDPLWKGRRLTVCRPLHNTLVQAGMSYEGVVAMTLRNRLSPDGSGLDARYVEPIWVFRKGRPAPPLHKPDVFDFFGGV